MAEIRPFPAHTYRNSTLEKVLAPPYDVIPPAYQDELYARDPHNIVRVILNRTPGDAGYAEAGETWAKLQREGVVGPDPEPALYLLEQRFEALGAPRVRFGLFARFRAVDASARVVLPHEHTRAAAKEDRWKVLNATKANFSPIFLMFPDAESRFAALATRVSAGAPTWTYTDDGGVGHRVWRIADAAQVGELQALLGGVKSYIADGHHRYATALRYRDANGPDAAFTLGYFTPMNEGLLVLPYHRILTAGPTPTEARQRLSELFTLTDAKDAAEGARLAGESKAPWAFALAWPQGGALVAEAKPEAASLLDEQAPACLRALDTYFFHKGVMPKRLGLQDDVVSYVHSFEEAAEALAHGKCAMAALMRPTPVQQIVDVAEASESMPAKSTFFHPKLPSGLVIHPLLV